MSPLAMGDACPVPGCERKRREGHLMCRTDWSRVSKATQQDVYRTWRAYGRLADSGADADVFHAAREAYEAAAERAIREAEA